MSADVQSEANPVLTASANLGCSLQHTPQWRAWREALKAFQDDADLSALTVRLRELTEHWRLTGTEGGTYSGKEAIELGELQGKLERHVLFKRKQAAECALIALLSQADGVISKYLRIDFADNVAPHGGCCGWGGESHDIIPAERGRGIRGGRDRAGADQA